jgi:hypothetical protein
VAGVTLVLVGAASCGDDDDDAGTDTTTRSTTVTEDPSTTDSGNMASLTATGEQDLAGVTLTADLVINGTGLTITYRLDNAGQQALAVADAVPEPQGSGFGPDPTGAWVTASSQGFVTIGKWPVDQSPEGGDRAEPQHLYLVRAEPGASVEGTITLGWPLRGNHPYLAPDNLPVALPDPVEMVRLCLGVEPLTTALEGSSASTVADGRTWLDVPMSDLRGILCTDPVSITS